MSSTSKGWLLKFGSILIGLVIALVASEFALRWYGDFVLSQEKMDVGLIQYDEKLGWKLAKNWSGQHQHFDYSAHYSTDFMGFRKSLVQKNIAKNRIRVLVMGDSFTFGLGVEDDLTFVSLMNRDNPDTTFINGGVPGYAPDQQMLWLSKAVLSTQPDSIVFIIYLGNDLVDIGLPFAVQAAYAKPYIALTEDGVPVVQNIPVPRESKPEALRDKTLGSYILDGDRSTFLERYKIGQLLIGAGLGSPAEKNDLDGLLEKKLEKPIALMGAALDLMMSEADQSFTLVLLPGASAVKNKSSVSARYQLLVRDKLVDLARQKNLKAIDLVKPLSEDGINNFYPNDGHLTVAGHEVVSKALMQSLSEASLAD
jgi:lysophospholipase L1-like esterase